MTDPASAPIFAGRYQFKPVRDDWDTGRTRYTHLVYDLKKKRFGVIKRAETNSELAKGLKNEVAALRKLKGSGVPEVYETGTTTYGSKDYFYIILEYIDALRVEMHLDSLYIDERADIITQLFGLLAKAHGEGIVNGDVDLKHLFWYRDQKRLVVIDWGNAQLGVRPNKETEFAFDLARSAEIIYSLMTGQRHPPSMDVMTLPDDAELMPALAPVPTAFRNLCRWAPRMPIDNSRAPHNALELFNISKKWSRAVKGEKSFKPLSWAWKLGIILAMGFAILFAPSFFKDIFYNPTETSTPTQIFTEILLTVPPDFTETQSPTVNPTDTQLTSTETPSPTSTVATLSAPTVLSTPGTYFPFLEFDDKVTFSSLPTELCWRKSISPSDIKRREGFFRKGDFDWWAFIVDKDRDFETSVQTGLSSCLNHQPFNALALNAWVTHLEPERENPPDAPGTYEPGREFGVFLEDQGGTRREYTLWVNKDDEIHLYVRENNNIVSDETISVVRSENLQHGGTGPRIYNKFPIQIFLEIDNDGFDILYLQEAPYSSLEAKDIDPNKMARIDAAALPTLGDIQEIGLIGRGGETQVLIWPLAFYQK